MEGNKPKRTVTIGVIGSANSGRTSLINVITKVLKENANLSNETLTEEEFKKNNPKQNIIIDISKYENDIQ